MKEDRKYLDMRTVEDILEEMEGLQGKGKHSMGAFEQYRLK